MTCRRCDRPATIKGMCNSHYQSHRNKLVRAGVWQRPIPVCGMTRRLRALVALGYSQNHLCSLSGLSPSTMSHLIRGSIDRTSRTVAEQVVALYDTISMTPGPSDEARNRARSSGWAPPLAWDDDEIDNPSATPHMGSRKRVPRHIEYQELKQLGFTDIEILHRWNIHPQSLMRMLRRAGITPSQELARIMEHRLFWVAS